MSDRKLFKRCLNSKVTCDYPSPSKWITKSKRYEKYGQYTSDEAKEIRPSAAIAEFSVENKDNPNQHALMKVFMQMPGLGTEFDFPEERAEQVSDESPETIYGEEEHGHACFARLRLRARTLVDWCLVGLCAI